AGAAEAVAHGGIADVEWRQHREQMAADITADVMCAELALDELHRRKDRPLRAAGAERGRAPVHVAGDRFLRPGAPRRRRRPPPPSRADEAGVPPSSATRSGRKLVTNLPSPSLPTPPVYSPAIGSMPLPSTRVCTSARRRMVLTACSMNSGWPSSTTRIALLPAQKRTSSPSISG